MESPDACTGTGAQSGAAWGICFWIQAILGDFGIEDLVYTVQLSELSGLMT